MKRSLHIWTIGLLFLTNLSETRCQQVLDSAVVVDQQQFSTAIKDVAPYLDFSEWSGKSQDIGSLMLRDLSPISFKEPLVAFDGASIEIDNTYNDGYFAFGQSGFLGKYTARASTNVLKSFPLDVSFTLANYSVERNDTIHTRWRPFFNVSFDYKQLKENLVQKSSLSALTATMRKQVGEVPEMQDVWQYQTISKLVNSPRFGSILDSLARMQDSLEMSLQGKWDSVTAAKQTEICYALESAAALQAKYVKLKKSYNQWQPYWTDSYFVAS